MCTAEMGQQRSTPEQIKSADGTAEVFLPGMEVLVPEEGLAGREPLDTDGADESIPLRVDPEDIPVDPAHVQQQVLNADEVRVANIADVGRVEVEQLVLEQGVEPRQFALTDLADAGLGRAAPRPGVCPPARGQGHLGGEQQ